MTPGAVFIEWNIEAEGPGLAAMWEVHVRVGGTDGSGLTSTKCPPVRAGVAPGCKGGSMMMRLTKSGSAYIENAWYWLLITILMTLRGKTTTIRWYVISVISHRNISTGWTNRD